MRMDDPETEKTEKGFLRVQGYAWRKHLEEEADPEKAAYRFRRSAEEGDPYGMFNYALHLAKGYVVQRNFKRNLKKHPDPLTASI